MQGQDTYPWRDAIRMLSLRRFSTMPASASIARVLPAFLFSILTVLPPLRSLRIRRVLVMASQR